MLDKTLADFQYLIVIKSYMCVVCIQYVNILRKVINARIYQCSAEKISETDFEVIFYQITLHVNLHL